MIHEIQDALNEIMDMPPMFRREYIINYIRKNLPKDEAKKVYYTRNKLRYCEKMMDEGYITYFSREEQDEPIFDNAEIEARIMVVR
jgi:hypothetical protein